MDRPDNREANHQQSSRNQDVQLVRSLFVLKNAEGQEYALLIVGLASLILPTAWPVALPTQNIILYSN